MSNGTRIIIIVCVFGWMQWMGVDTNTCWLIAGAQVVELILENMGAKI